VLGRQGSLTAQLEETAPLEGGSNSHEPSQPYFCTAALQSKTKYWARSAKHFL
jgi:hypothetical protein